MKRAELDAAIFGLIVADLIVSPMDLRRPPARGGLQLVDTIELTTGGNVCNTGMAMAKLGMKVAAAGLVGRDVLGASVIERLKNADLDTSAVFTTDKAQTSATVVAVEPGGERCFFHSTGATVLLDAEAFERCLELFSRCALVQVGYFGLLPALTPDLPSLLQSLKKRAPHVRIALDTVNPPGPMAQLEPILPHLDIFCPSRSEAELLTGESEPARMVRAFRPWIKTGLIGIKLDSDGCYLDDGQRPVLAPVYPVKVVDTTGAGDTWFAGLLTALRHEMPLEEAARFANRVAADCCTALGASAGVQTFDKTVARL